jgi:hypothetical protein
MIVVLPAATKSTGRYFQVMAQTVVDKIPPGPKLDALTAEKVFGWKNVHQHEAPAKPQTVFPLLTILWWWFFDWWLFGRWFFNRRVGLVFIWWWLGWLFGVVRYVHGR